MKIEELTLSSNIDGQNEIIIKIRDLINYRNVEPGEKLPSERILSNKFGASRNDLRAAIQKLEAYGLLKSIPKKGTFVTDIGIVALNGIIDNILRLKKFDIKSIIETRIHLELKTVGLAAERRTNEDLKNLEDALNVYKEKVFNNESAMQEDLLFHMAIARASGNSPLNKALLMIVPDIISNFEKHLICNKEQAFTGIKGHTDIFNAIKSQDVDMATQLMKEHFNDLYSFDSEQGYNNIA